MNEWVLSVALILVTALAYMPAWNGQPIWDDNGHLTRPELRSLTGLKRIWIEPGAAQQYYPLVHTFFWIANRIWGLEPLGYHLANIVFHALSALLLVRILWILGIPGAWLAAALFALHPVQVESVAWISELKNTLSGIFYLSAALVYLQFDRKRNWVRWALALVLFVLGLLSKSVIGTLPAALLVVFWWKRGKLDSRSDVLPLMPFFVLAAVTGIFTAWMEREFIGAEGAAFNYSFIERSLIAGRAIWFYLSKLVWPANLTFIYPQWQISQEVWWQYLFAVGALALLAVAWRFRSWSRAPLAALMLFVGTLFPALGFINIYPFAYSFVADHFQYLACIAPLTLASAAVWSVSQRPKFRAPVQTFSVILLGVLTLLTWRQSGMYVDMKTLWDTTIARNPACWMAYNNRGLDSLKEGRQANAIADFEIALRLNPNNAQAHNNLGVALDQQQRPDEASRHFEKAIEIKPDYAEAYENLSTIYFQRGELDRAVSSLQEALRIKPGYADAHFNLGIVLREKGDLKGSVVQFQEGLKIRPADADALRELGLTLLRQGRADEAIGRFQQAVAINSGHLQALVDLGNTYLQTGRPGDAIVEFQRALALRPTDLVTLNNLAWVLASSSEASLRDGKKAVELAYRARELTRGADPNVLRTLSAAYAETGQFQRAATTALQALQITGDRSPLADTLRKELALYQSQKALP